MSRHRRPGPAPCIFVGMREPARCTVGMTCVARHAVCSRCTYYVWTETCRQLAGARVPSRRLRYLLTFSPVTTLKSSKHVTMSSRAAWELGRVSRLYACASSGSI